MKTKINTRLWLFVALGSLLLRSSVDAQSDETTGWKDQIIQNADQFRQQTDVAVSAIVNGMPAAPIATTTSSSTTPTTIAPATIIAPGNNNVTNTTTTALASAPPTVDPCANYTRPPSIAVSRPPTSSTMTPTTMAPTVNNRQMNTNTPTSTSTSTSTSTNTNTNTNSINTNATTPSNVTTATATISPTFDELYYLCSNGNIRFNMTAASKGNLTFTLNEGPSAAPSEGTERPTRAPTTKESSPDSSPSGSSSSTTKESRPSAPKESNPKTPRPTTLPPSPAPSAPRPTNFTRFPAPTARPTTAFPTARPTTAFPTARPTTAAPTISVSPSKAPSEFPTFAPSVSPSEFPTARPTLRPTNSPTNRPTNNPTVSPTTDICTVCPDRSDPGNLFKRFIFLNEILSCGDLDIRLRRIDDDPTCDGYNFEELDVDGPAYCECPDRFPPNNCVNGLCGEFGALDPAFGEVVRSDLSCNEWDDWARSAFEQTYCDSLVERYKLQDCCLFFDQP